LSRMSKWMTPNQSYMQLRDEYWNIAKDKLTQKKNMEFLSWAVDTSRNRDVLYLLVLSFAIKRCMQLDIFHMHWKSKLSSDLCMTLTMKEERRLLLDDARILGVVHKFHLESFRPNTFTLSPLKGQSQSYIKFMTSVLSLLDPMASPDSIADAMKKLIGEEGDIADKDHKQFWKEKELSFPRKIAFKHCTQLSIDRISSLLKGLQMNVNASLLLFEMVFHGTPLSHREVSNIIANENYVTPHDDQYSPFLSVRTKCKVCYNHAMDTATTLWSRSVNVMRHVMKEKLNKSNLTEQEKARVAALVNFKVDEYLPAAIARLLFSKPDIEEIKLMNSLVDEDIKSIILQWAKVPYINKCQCDGRPHHSFIRSCLFLGLDAIHSTKSIALVNKVEDLLFSSDIQENSDTVVNAFIEFFYNMSKFVVDDDDCHKKKEKNKGDNKGKKDDLLDSNGGTEDKSNSGSVHDDSNCDEQNRNSINEKSHSKVKKGDCPFILDSVEVDKEYDDLQEDASDEGSEFDASDNDEHDHDNDDDNNNEDQNACNDGIDINQNNNIDDNCPDVKRKLEKVAARVASRGIQGNVPIEFSYNSSRSYVPSLSTTQIIDIAKKFDPEESFSDDLHYFLQWMFTFSTGPSLTITNDFAQHNCHMPSSIMLQNERTITQPNTETKSDPRRQFHKSLSVTDNEKEREKADAQHYNPDRNRNSLESVKQNVSKTQQQKHGEKTVKDRSIKESPLDAQHFYPERNHDYLGSPEHNVRKKLQQKHGDKTVKDTPIKKILDHSSTSEKTKTLTNNKGNNVIDTSAAELPRKKKLKTKHSDRRLIDTFFGK